MVHTLKSVGEGTGAMFRGMTPVATLPIYFGTAKMTTGVMSGISKKVAGKKTKKKKSKKKKKR